MGAYEDMMGGTEERTAPEPDKGIIGNAWDDVVSIAKTYVAEAVQGAKDVMSSGNQLAQDNPLALSGTPVQEGMTNAPAPAQSDQQQQDYNAYQESTGNFANNTIKPVVGLAAIAGSLPYVGPAMGAAGAAAGAAYSPFFASDIIKSAKKGGVGQVASDFTVGPALDIAAQPNLGEQFHKKPVTTAYNVAMATLPFYLVGKGVHDVVKSNALLDKAYSIPETNPLQVQTMSPYEAMTQGLVDNKPAVSESPALPVASGVENYAGVTPETKAAANDFGSELKQDYGIDAVVTSGKRSEENNTAVNGAENSWHLQGKAVDLDIGDVTPEQQVAIKAKAEADGWGEVLYHDAGTGVHLHLADYQGKTSGNFDSWFSAVAQQESGGDYNAVGQNVPGQGRAQGKFQIMPDNWEPWSKEAGLPDGSEMTPANQEIVAKYKLQQYYDKYGPDGALVAWYAGEENGARWARGEVDAIGEGGHYSWDAKQGDAPSVREYVQQAMDKAKTAGYDRGTAATNAPDTGISSVEANNRLVEENKRTTVEANNSLNGIEQNANDGWKKTGEEYLKDQSDNKKISDTVYKIESQPWGNNADEINNKNWYHGTGTEGLTPDSLSTHSTKIEGLFGHGVYLTDNPEIAQGYANARGNKTKTPTVYQAKVNVVNVLDLEKPMPDKAYSVFRKEAELTSRQYGEPKLLQNIEDLHKNGASGDKIYRAYSQGIEEISRDQFIPKSEFVESFQDLSGNLKEAGYDAYTHTGGKRTGKNPHQVLIMLDPKDELSQTGRKNQIYKFEPVKNSKKSKTYSKILDDHKQIVEDALKRGDPVPDKVLNEYPDLATKYNEAGVGNQTYGTLKDGEFGSVTNPDVVPSAPAKINNVTKPELINAIDKLVQTRTGNVSKGFLGLYKGNDKVIRVRSYGDFETYSHEIGHAIDGTLNIPGHDFELIANADKIWQGHPVYDKYSPATKRAEGIAEFGRQYLLNPTEAQKNFPRYFDAFQQKLAENPKFAKQFNNIGDMMKSWYAQTPEARNRGSISFGSDKSLVSPTSRAKQLSNRSYELFVNDLDPIQRITAQVEHELGRKLNFDENPYLRARAAQGMPGMVSEMILQEKDVAILKDLLNESYGGKIKYAVSMYDVFKGIDDRVMNAKYPTYLKDGNFANWHQALSTLLTTKASIERKDVNYAQPLKLAQDKLVEANQRVKDAVANNEPLKSVAKATAQQRLAENELKHIQQAGYKTPVDLKDAQHQVDNAPPELHDAAEKFYQYNDNLLSIKEYGGLVSSKLAQQLRDKYQDYAAMNRDFSAEGESGSQSMGGSAYGNISNPIKKLKEGGSAQLVIDPLESAARDTAATLSAVERNMVAQVLVKYSDSPGVGQVLEKLPGVKTGDAKKSIFTVMTDGEKQAYQTTPEYYRAIQSLKQETLPAWLTPVKWFSQALRLGVTIAPDFIIRNMLKDTITASVFSHTGFKPLLGTIEGIKTQLTDKRLNAEYKFSGVPLGTFVGRDRRAISDYVSKISGDSKRLSSLPVFKQAELIYEGLRRVGETIESSPRITEYANARAQGKSVREASVMARDVSVDFLRGGTISRVWNQIDPFFNATIQGGDRLARSFDKKDALSTVAKAVTYITVPSIALWAFNHDQQWYQELSDDDKNQYWIINTSGGLLRIPKPFEPGTIFGSLPERALEQMAKENPEAMKNWAKYAINNFKPGLMPAVIGPLIQWQTNYDFYRDKPVVNQREQNLPDAQQYNAYTTEFAKKIGAAANLSPEKIDMAIKGYLGSAGSFVASSLDNVIPGHTVMPDKNFAEQPGVKGLFKTPLSNPKSVQDFYDHFTEVEKNYNATGKKGNPPNDVAGMRGFDSQITALNKDNRNILNSDKLDATAKRQKMDANNAKILSIAKKANSKYPPNY